MEFEGIILAAGLSSRAKAFKMTLEFEGKTVIENTIDNMLTACNRIYLVGGYQIDALKPIVERYHNVQLVENCDYLQGMYSSVKKALEYVNAERFFLTPGDYPLISPKVYKSLTEHTGTVVIPTFEGKKGHPVLLDKSIRQQVMNRDDFQSLRDVICANESVLVPVGCRGVLLDIDTLEDYELLKQLKKEEGYEKGHQ